MILCGIPIIMKAVIGLVTAFDIKADVHSDKEYFNNSYRVFLVLVYKCGQEKSNNLYY